MKKYMSLFYITILLLGGSLIFVSCSDNNKEIPVIPDQQKPDGEEHKRVTTDEQYWANLFARGVMEYNYVWNEEIATDLPLLNPDTNVNPIKTVSDIRYHKGDKQIDKWTSLIDDLKKFQDGISGVSTTYGYLPITYLMKKGGIECISAVAYVSKDGAAAKAGLKRGDLIYKINGQQLTIENYKQLFESSSITLSLAKLEKDSSGVGFAIVPIDKDIILTAVNMYENPVLLDSIYEVNGKKIGYLAYASFDLNSIPKLIEISQKFKTEGVSELILDLRYNGGGYVITENVMGSMYAPKAAVDAEEIFEIEKYNKKVTKEFEDEGIPTKTPFKTEFNFQDMNGLSVHVSTKNANIGLRKIYGLITQNTASASEALLGALMPFMDVEVIGTPSHGKYCTGWLISAKDVYKKVPKPISNWGIYLMVSIFQNSKGETPCMPDGLQPTFIVNDDPMMPEQLGDVNELMLKVALQRAGKVYVEEEIKSRSGFVDSFQHVYTHHKALFGKRILLSESIPLSLN